MIKIIYKLIPDWFKIIIFKVGGKKPWSRGYTAFKFKYIKEELDNPENLKKFKNSEPLPKGYGYGIDQRAVECSWVLSRIPETEKACLLDAGSSLNFKILLESPALKNKNITIVNLNPESECFWQKKASYIFADMREMPFKSDYFDYITCISTLQHIGMDNVLYTKEAKWREAKVFDFEKAAQELKRVLKKGGKLFITVPFGKYQNLGWLQQFDFNLINRILQVFQPRNYHIDYYRYTKEGWVLSSEIESRNCEYSENNSKKNNDFGFLLISGFQAIACIELIKS